MDYYDILLASKLSEGGSGGGGSSDFSTANVTVNVEGYSAGMPRYGIANAPYIDQADKNVTVNVEGYSAGMPRYGIANAPYIDQADKLVEGIGLPTSGTYHAVLYMGSVEWQINAGSDDIPITGVNVTGSAEVSEYSGDYFISITGDCSITVNYGTK